MNEAYEAGGGRNSRRNQKKLAGEHRSLYLRDDRRRNNDGEHFAVGQTMKPISGHTTRIQNCLDRLRNGEVAARHEIFVCAEERLRRLTRAMFHREGRLRRFEETDDVFQHASLRLWRALDDTVPESVVGFMNLAATQVRRVLLDLSRSYFGPEGLGTHRAGFPSLGRATETTPFELDASDDTHDPARLESWTSFHRAAEELPDELREVFDFVFYAALSSVEVASLLGVTERTVNRRLAKAKTAIRNALGGSIPGLG